jgi:hypothetical protein
MTAHRTPTTRDWQAWWHASGGQVLAYVVPLVIGILVLIGLSLDGGLALAAKVRATGQAESAARAGAQALDLAAYRANGALHLLPVKAENRARAYLTSIGATGTVNATIDTVTVTVTATRRTQLLWLAGISNLSAHGQGSAHPERG